MSIIKNKSFDEERALYNKQHLILEDCAFAGPADGESALKECADITVKNTLFDLRYPCWHDHGLTIEGGNMTSLCRAALWYSDHIKIDHLKMHGIKALRECSRVEINGSDIDSPEFGWSTRNIKMTDTTANSEYFMMRSEQLRFSHVKMTGKYSFQYIKDAVFEDCEFDTKDAFWHGENVVVRNSVVKGEYLAWYAKNITFENCKIIGTQPFCYVENLKLINCEMVDCDLAFEKSSVDAVLTKPIVSIKNPRSGTIRVPSVGEIIRDEGEAKIILEDPE